MVHPAANPSIPVRSVLIIDPNKKVRLILACPPNTGSNFDEILRVIEVCNSPTRTRRRRRSNDRAIVAGEFPCGQQEDRQDGTASHVNQIPYAAGQQPRIDWPARRVIIRQLAETPWEHDIGHQ
jgi:hypothetical protein